MFIYVLKLYDDKYYVGKTENIETRLRAHYNGKGSSWTQKYPALQTIETIECDDPYDEDKVTLKYMERYGIENVRGGAFCRVHLTAQEKNTITQMIHGNTERCFRCGQRGHFVAECSLSSAYEPWSHEEDERLKQEMTEGMSVKEMSEKHGRTPGAIRSRMKRVDVLEPLLLQNDHDEDDDCCSCF
jgi:predicted GIY-YIG superfamily endonuclease